MSNNAYKSSTSPRIRTRDVRSVDTVPDRAIEQPTDAVVHEVLMSEARRRAAELAHLHAFISMTEEDGDGPVVAVKDLIDVAGARTTGGGILLPDEPAAADAEVVARVRRVGCSVIGKTNLHEWAYGVTSANPHYGFVLNPHDPTRVAGGSSGGSAVAVAAGMCDWAIGTDTGGSIRIPASLCGVVGFKPTVGTLPTDRVIPLSRSLDTIGPLASSVAAATAALQVMLGERDPNGVGPLRREPVLAVPRGWIAGLDDETEAAWQAVAGDLPQTDFPDRAALAEVADTILRREAFEFHARWLRERPDAYGEDVRERLTSASRVTREEYQRALEQASPLRQAAADAMRAIDALLVPATAIVAPRIDQPGVREPLTRFTRPFNATGQPVISVPAPARGLPVGIQVVGKFGDDLALAAVAAYLEERWSAA